MIQKIKLVTYLQQYGEHWADVLPENCPPEEVCIAAQEVFYRFTLSEDAIVPRDWFNHLTLYPKINFEDRIIAAGLSLWNCQERILKEKKLPAFKKCKGLAKISLMPEDGVIKQTSKDFYHYTWWRTTMCNLKKAELV